MGYVTGALVYGQAPMRFKSVFIGLNIHGI